MLDVREGPSTYGTSLAFTEDPILKVHHQRKPARDQLTSAIYQDLANASKTRKREEETGVSIEIKPDLKYISVAERCAKGRKYGIDEQIQIKHNLKSQNRLIAKEQQKALREYWDDVNYKVDQAYRDKKLDEAKMVRAEISKHEKEKLNTAEKKKQDREDAK